MTLMEVLISLVLFSMIVLGFSSIDFFSHFHVISSDRRAKIQNEASFIIDHMTKHIGLAIGNEWVYGSDTVIHYNQTIPRKNVLLVKQDTATPFGQLTFLPTLPADQWTGYEYWKQDAADGNRYELKYCSNYLLGGRRDPLGSLWGAPTCDTTYETLSARVTQFLPQILPPYKPFTPATKSNIGVPGCDDLFPQYTSRRCLSSNSFDLTVTVCWDPDELSKPCGDPENPSVTMTSRIVMPAVSSN